MFGQLLYRWVSELCFLEESVPRGFSKSVLCAGGEEDCSHLFSEYPLA